MSYRLVPAKPSGVEIPAGGWATILANAFHPAVPLGKPGGMFSPLPNNDHPGAPYAPVGVSGGGVAPGTAIQWP